MIQYTDVDKLFKELISGNRVALGQAITLIESTLDLHRTLAAQLLDKCLSVQRHSFRFAVSGAPGVGKSTFIEALGERILKEKHKLAILAIDPTSPVSQGSILGDKTRMESLSRNPDVFIRPTAAGKHLGGVAATTRETILLCEAAGYDHICIETVGVGQSELAAFRMTDFFLLLLLPGGGDELQGIKKGIVEIADLIAITKADTEHLKAARETQRYYAQAVHFTSERAHQFPVQVMTCSARENRGIDELWLRMKEFLSHITTSGYYAEQRAQQNAYWLESRLQGIAMKIILADEEIGAMYQQLRSSVVDHATSVTSAIHQLSEHISGRLQNTVKDV